MKLPIFAGRLRCSARNASLGQREWGWLPTWMLLVAVALSTTSATLMASTTVQFVQVVKAEACNAFVVLPAFEKLAPREKSRAALQLVHLEQLSCMSTDPEYLAAVLALVVGFENTFAVTARPTNLVVIPVVGGKHNGLSVSLELIRAGLARPNDKAPESYLAVEDEARREGRGWCAAGKAAGSSPAVSSDRVAFVLDALAGEYVLVGREPGGGAGYSGTARIKVEGERVTLVRALPGEERLTLVGGLEQALGGEAQILRLRVPAGRGREMTCLERWDLDNYLRLTCYWTYQDEPAPKQPGLEAYFPTAVWPVP